MGEENSSKQTFGELDQKSFDFEVITWKISKVSSILLSVDYGIQSPSFTIAGASWILKIYFYGQKKFNTRGYIDVTIERLHSEIETHESSWKIYCKNAFGREFQPIFKKFRFYPTNDEMNVNKIMENFQGKRHRWELTPNDTFTLVCEVQNEKTMDVTNLVETSGNRSTVSRSSQNPEVGEIYQTSYINETVKWTIRNVSSLPSPAYEQVQSPQFSFASAFWTLKMYPYFRLEHENKQCFYVALTRLHSQILEHYISVNICFEDRIRKAFDEVSRSYIFDSDHMQGDPICFTLREGQTNAPGDIFILFCKFKTKKKIGSELEITEIVSGNACQSRLCESPCQNKVLQDLKEFYVKQEDCDVIITVKGKKFPAHRAILQARSPVFNSAFRSDMKEKATGVIDIKDCDPVPFSDFLCFLYCGDIENLSVSNVFSLFTIADKYSVLDLRLKCIEFMIKNLTIDTFCDTIILALQHSEDELLKRSTDFFAKNVQKIIVTVKWQSFITENPIQGNELVIKALTLN